MIIRKIQKEDNEALASVIHAVLSEFGANMPGTVFTDPTTDQLFELFAKEGSVYYVAYQEDRLIGGCGIYPTPNLPSGYAELVKFYLLNEARGLGIGKELMLKCFEFAKQAGYTHLYLESLPQLDIAVGMYEKYGFEHIPERLGESGHFACNILMLKKM